VLGALRDAAGDLLLDLHTDAHHNRCVLTLCSGRTDRDELGAIRSAIAARIEVVARTAVAKVDLREHRGVHPRLGSLDVVPFVSLRRDASNRVCNGPIEEALEARAEFMTWAAAELGLPCFAYGPERSLPEVRRRAFSDLRPDAGPPEPHPTDGSCAVGARPILVAYNLWISGGPELALSIARDVRGPTVRALGLSVGRGVQVSVNLLDPFRTGPVQVYDRVALLAEEAGAGIERAELVGLVPMKVLADSPAHRLAELGLNEEHTIELLLDDRKS
jgi:glutamate formiminotransferase